VLQQGVSDTHLWRLSASDQYSTRSAYKALFQGATLFQLAERVWKTWAPGKCKFFMWLVEHNRCWTSNRLAKRSMDHPNHCLLCEQEEKTVSHLLISCAFARQVWFDLLGTIGLQELALQPADDSFEAWWSRSSTRMQGQHRQGFNSLIILRAWVIWKHRNQCRAFHLVSLMCFKQLGTRLCCGPWQGPRTCPFSMPFTHRAADIRWLSGSRSFSFPFTGECLYVTAGSRFGPLCTGVLVPLLSS
jgi:hypothetical protein